VHITKEIRTEARPSNILVNEADNAHLDLTKLKTRHRILHLETDAL
jgi:hypothetical protein